MIRPCFLVVDRERFGGISTRKLVIETAKFNVITAYSAKEAVETAEKFPHVDGVVLDAGIQDLPCTELVAGLRALLPGKPIVVVGDSTRHPCSGETLRLETFDPKELLRLLQELLPESTVAIELREEELSNEQEGAGS